MHWTLCKLRTHRIGTILTWLIMSNSYLLRLNWKESTWDALFVHSQFVFVYCTQVNNQPRFIFVPIISGLINFFPHHSWIITKNRDRAKNFAGVKGRKYQRAKITRGENNKDENNMGLKIALYTVHVHAVDMHCYMHAQWTNLSILYVLGHTCVTELLLFTSFWRPVWKFYGCTVKGNIKCQRSFSALGSLWSTFSYPGPKSSEWLWFTRPSRLHTD